MGMSLMKSCSVNPRAAAPDPVRWKLVHLAEFTHGHVLDVHYDGCTNFDGRKILVYRGNYRGPVALDPHFSDDAASPLARFRPDDEGWSLALSLAASLT